MRHPALDLQPRPALRTVRNRTVGGPLITGQDLALYCAQTIDSPLTAPQRDRVARAISKAESLIVRVESVRDDYPRLLKVRAVYETLHDSDLQPVFENPLVDISVIRVPRYAVRNREAPKRSTLIRRLWSALR